MLRSYEKLKGLTVKTENYEGIVAGFNGNKLVLAVETNPTASFRRLEKDTFIEEEYKDSRFRYCYSDERYIEQQHGIKYKLLDVQTNRRAL